MKAILIKSMALALLLLTAPDLYAGDMLQPVKISKAKIAGQIFEDYEPLVTVSDDNTTRDVEVFLSKDKDFDAGIWSSEANVWEITDPYPYNEYMHFIDGSVTLTSSDGTVTQVNAGDSVIIPRGWTGTWDTPGCTKLYAIHAPDKNL